MTGSSPDVKKISIDYGCSLDYSRNRIVGGFVMKHPPRISDAEWDVMRVLWTKGAATAREVVDLLAHRDWSPRTVKTLLSRLKAKGALTYEAQGKAYVYRPAFRMQDSVRQESQS